MGEYLRVWWTPRFEGPTRADRMGGWYHPYSPDPLDGWDPSIPGSLAASISEAEEAIRVLNRSDVRLSGLAGLGRFLLRAESVGSSAIEGLRVGPRRLLAAEEQNARGWTVNDRVAEEVLGNITAMRRATDLGTRNRPLTLDDMLEVHQLLMSRSPNPELGGALREEQNWIGGSSFNPCNASYVPPPPDRVPELMTDLMAYVNTDHHSPLAQAAIAHAQFETIHPFGDGNGRTGRALIHIVAPETPGGAPVRAACQSGSLHMVRFLRRGPHRLSTRRTGRQCSKIPSPRALAGNLRSRYPDSMPRRSRVQPPYQSTDYRVEPEAGTLPQRISLGSVGRRPTRRSPADSRTRRTTGRTIPGRHQGRNHPTSASRHTGAPTIQHPPQPDT